MAYSVQGSEVHLGFIARQVAIYIGWLGHASRASQWFFWMILALFGRINHFVERNLSTHWRSLACADEVRSGLVRNSRTSVSELVTIVAFYAACAFSGGFLSNVGRNPSSCHALSLFTASSETVMLAVRNPWFSGPHILCPFIGPQGCIGPHAVGSHQFGNLRRWEVRLNRQLSRSDESPKIVS